MASSTRYPVSVVNVQGNTIPYRECSEAALINNGNNSCAHWGNSNQSPSIASRNGSRHHPSGINAHFDFTGAVPAKAKVTKIKVEYRYWKRSYSSSTAHGSFGSPTITIPHFNQAKMGVAPVPWNASKFNNDSEWAKSTLEFPVELTGQNILDNGFDVIFQIADNTSTNTCWIQMQYLRVTIEYTNPNYIPQISLNKTTLKYGDTCTVTCTLSETNHTIPSELVSAQITIPDGFKIIEAPGNLEQTSMIWLDQTQNYTARMSFVVELVDKTRVGDLKFSILEHMTMHSSESSTSADNRSSSTTIYVPQAEIKVTDFYLEPAEIFQSNGNSIGSLSIEIENNAQTEVKLNIDMGGLTLVNPPSNYKDGVLTITEYQRNNDGNYRYNTEIRFYAATAGNFQINMTSTNFIGAYSKKVTAYIPDTYEEYYTLINASDFALNSLVEGETYVFGCLCRVKSSLKLEQIKGKKTLRASVLHGNEIFTNQVSQIGDWEWLTCKFVYNPSKPLQFKFYGNYIEYDVAEVEFGNLCLVSDATYYGYEYPTLAFQELEKGYLISQGTKYDHILLEPPIQNPSTRHYFYQWDWKGLDENSSLIIHGIEITGEISTEETINLVLGFGNSNIAEEEYYIDSLNITKDDTDFSFGGKFKSFGIPFNKINELLNNFRFYLVVDDIGSVQSDVSMRNVQITIYYTINTDCWEFWVNGISSKHYLLDLMEDTELPRGANYDSNTYKVEGADGVFPNRVNIEEKKLKLKFTTCECGEPEDIYSLLRAVVEWLYPHRDSLDNPELNTISFFLDPENGFDYYIEEEMDVEFADGGCDCEVELIVPAGLARSIEPVTKSFAGDVGYIGKIRPEITFYKQIVDSEPIQLLEQESGQICKIDGDFIRNLPDNCLLKLDCANKKLYYQQYGEWFLVDPNCISLDSDFFLLNGHYDFENSKNCKVAEVIYYNLSG